MKNLAALSRQLLYSLLRLPRQAGPLASAATLALAGLATADAHLLNHLETLVKFIAGMIVSVIVMNVILSHLNALLERLKWEGVTTRDESQRMFKLIKDLLLPTAKKPELPDSKTDTAHNAETTE